MAYLKTAWKEAHVRAWDRGGGVMSVFIALGLADVYSFWNLSVAAVQVHEKYSIPSSYLTLMLQFSLLWIPIAFKTNLIPAAVWAGVIWKNIAFGWPQETYHKMWGKLRSTCYSNLLWFTLKTWNVLIKQPSKQQLKFKGPSAFISLFIFAVEYLSMELILNKIA